MDGESFDAMVRRVSVVASRRGVLRAGAGALAGVNLGLRGLGGAALGWGAARLPVIAEAKDASKRKPNQINRVAEEATGTQQEIMTVLCRRDGSPCRKRGDNCRAQFCLNAPFTITAKWKQTADHDAYLFVPGENASTGPSPYIDRFCTQADSPNCDKLYPFACHTGDETVSGSEVITVSQLLPERYEYWIQLYRNAPAGALTIALKDNDGRVVRRWTNPANTEPSERPWHVFDFKGDTGRVASIDKLFAVDPAYMPDAAHTPNTDVCPS